MFTRQYDTKHCIVNEWNHRVDEGSEELFIIFDLSAGLRWLVKRSIHF